MNILIVGNNCWLADIIKKFILLQRKHTTHYSAEPPKEIINYTHIIYTGNHDIYNILKLSNLCIKHNIHFTYFGYVKEEAGKIMDLYDKNVLNLCIHMPLDSVEHEENYITKITSHPFTCSRLNSMTVLPTLLPYLVQLLETKYTGPLNFTNPGMISHNEIIAQYKKIVKTDFTLDKQIIDSSNSILETTKLETLFPDIMHVRDAVNYVLS